jgi:membrane protein YqaA with SNARE-associated domain
MKEILPKKSRKLILFILLSVFLITLFILSIIIDSEELINSIGTKKGYIVLFFVAFFAGFSAFTIVSYYSILIAFIAGGMNPLFIILISGLSLTLGDLFIFYFGKNGRDLISGRADRWINRISLYFSKNNRGKYIPYFAYIYISFLPLPNDWLLLFLASLRFPQKKMHIIILLGDFSHAFLLTFLIVKGVLFFD